MSDTAFCDVDTKIEFLARQVCVDIIRRDFKSAAKAMLRAKELDSIPLPPAPPPDQVTSYLDGDLICVVTQKQKPRERSHFLRWMTRLGFVTVGELRAAMSQIEAKLSGKNSSTFSVYLNGSKVEGLGRKVFHEMYRIAKGIKFKPERVLTRKRKGIH